MKLFCLYIALLAPMHLKAISADANAEDIPIFQEEKKHPCLSIDDAQKLLPETFLTEEGVGMEEYNGITILYKNGKVTEELDEMDFQNSESSGIKLDKDGVIILFMTAPDAFKKSLKAAKSKLNISKELKWNIKGIEHSVLIIGNNQQIVKAIQDSLTKNDK